MPSDLTDYQDELFDIVDENDKVIGQATRREVHKNPKLIHRSIAIIIYSTDKRIFLQRRSMSKDTDKGKWTISCSGHIGSGDSYKKAAERELQEELGIKIPLSQLAKYLVRSPQETEMTVLFTAVSDGPFTLATAEITGGKFVRREELEREVENGRIELSDSGKRALEKIGWLQVNSILP